MDSFDIIITPDAEADLLEIRDYIAYTLLVQMLHWITSVQFAKRSRSCLIWL